LNKVLGYLLGVVIVLTALIWEPLKVLGRRVDDGLAALADKSDRMMRGGE
jgi:hypothetical protein